MTLPTDSLQASTGPAAPMLPMNLARYAYTAQTEHGLRFSGTLEAPDGGAAVHVLESMHLRVTEVTAVDKPHASPRAGDEAFVLFNQQLAQLARSGLPVERGLRLIATDMRRGKLARAVAAVSADLQAGVPLGEAFAKQRQAFPRIYGRLLDASLRGGNIPGVLLNLGRHVDTQKRLQAALWRNTARPAMTLCALLIVVGFIGGVVMPQFRSTFVDFRMKLPELTQIVFWFGGIAPYLALAAIATIALFVIAWLILRITGAGPRIADRFLLRLPFVGPVLRYSLIARWVDAVRIGVMAGLELPAAIELAGDATASPVLRRDGAMIAALLAEKKPIGAAAGKLLPAIIPATLEFSAGQIELGDTLQTLCDLYSRQAELRLERIPAIITPVLVMAIAVLIGFIVVAMILPLLWMLRDLTKFV